MVYARCGGQGGSEFIGALQRREVTDAVDVLQPDVGKEVVEPVGPSRRKAGPVLARHHCRHRDPVS
jgi:hypothetical protein